jgi:hypothetical protein
MTRRWRKPTGVVLQDVTALVFGGSPREGEAPAEPNNTVLGRARLLPSRAIPFPKGKTPDHTPDPATSQAFGSAGASPSQMGKLQTIRGIQQPVSSTPMATQSAVARGILR